MGTMPEVTRGGRDGLLKKRKSLCFKYTSVKCQISLQCILYEVTCTVDRDLSVGWGIKPGGPLGVFRKEKTSSPYIHYSYITPHTTPIHTHTHTHTRSHSLILATFSNLHIIL